VDDDPAEGPGKRFGATEKRELLAGLGQRAFDPAAVESAQINGLGCEWDG
jgi:hypothetical protein